MPDILVTGTSGIKFYDTTEWNGGSTDRRCRQEEVGTERTIVPGRSIVSPRPTAEPRQKAFGGIETWQIGVRIAQRLSPTLKAAKRVRRCQSRLRVLLNK